MWRWPVSVGFLLIAAATTPSCYAGGTPVDGSEISRTCARVEAALRSCNLLTVGEYECHGFAQSSCYADCLESASCDATYVSFCSHRGTTLTQCMDACSERDIPCRDGHGTSTVEELCNGKADCYDASDEAGCRLVNDRERTFVGCSTGELQSEISEQYCAGRASLDCSEEPEGDTSETLYGERCAAWVANLRECGIASEGYYYCNEPDMSDDCGCFEAASCAERAGLVCDLNAPAFADCMEACRGPSPEPDRFDCGGDSSVHPFLVCDGNDDCPDGRDETDCKYFECSDGTLISPRARCDGHERHCADGEDELRCASRICR